jgi:hypothetical protein
MFADISSVPWRPKTPPFAPNSLLKASNISKFLQWSQNDQILPNCQQSRQKHLVSSRNFSFLWKMPFRLLKVKEVQCAALQVGYIHSQKQVTLASWIPMLHAARISLKRMQWAILHLFQRVWERCDSTIQKNSCKNTAVKRARPIRYAVSSELQMYWYVGSVPIGRVCVCYFAPGTVQR